MKAVSFEQALASALVGGIGVVALSTSTGMHYGRANGWLMLGSFCMLGMVLVLLMEVE